MTKDPTFVKRFTSGSIGLFAAILVLTSCNGCSKHGTCAAYSFNKNVKKKKASVETARAFGETGREG